MRDFLLSDEFSRYQIKLIEVMNGYITSMMSQGKFQEAQGAIRMAHIVLNHPSKVSTSEDVVKKQIESMRRFQSNFIRMGMETDIE